MAGITGRFVGLSYRKCMVREDKGLPLQASCASGSLQRQLYQRQILAGPGAHIQSERKRLQAGPDEGAWVRPSRPGSGGDAGWDGGPQNATAETHEP
jgi:hypothetical protein